MSIRYNSITQKDRKNFLFMIYFPMINIFEYIKT